ncbi:LacI family transcriptional regulator [Aureimonas flava]|uniref:LacI family transcriptional regulator n=1 Tax=Aureimonas flava TaxID=2320271 RepID=A0A3A1WIE0_9HYPH|nr:LacI family DNA-binding transcriptional regulator [Aureimonas flava]RIX99193.1 LacI family transcriptional regulator [Aureimonas flava]
MNADRQGRATIKDVAREAGVSAMTVSNVVNNKTQFVGAAARARVEAAIERLGYRRQASARNLRGAGPRSIGMVIVDESPAFLANFFTAQLVAGLANVLNRADWTLTLSGLPPDGLAASALMRTYDVGGLCAMVSGAPEARREVLRRLCGLGQPVVLFQEVVETEGLDLCLVRQDDEGGGRRVGEHLARLGARSVLAMLPRQSWPAIENRLAGLAAGLGGAPRAAISVDHDDFSAVQEALGAWIAAHGLPDAVWGANDQIASAALLHLLDRGVAVPGRVRVVGFNDFPAHRHARPRLTTLASPAYELGERAGEAMLRRLEGGRFETQDLCLPVAFLPGETG